MIRGIKSFEIDRDNITVKIAMSTHPKPAELTFVIDELPAEIGEKLEDIQNAVCKYVAEMFDPVKNGGSIRWE